MRISDWSSDVCSSDLARRGGRIEMVVDLGRVEARDGHGRKERGEKIGAGLSQLVEDERCTRSLGEDGEPPGAGGGIEHTRWEARRVGKECVSTGRSMWAQFH